MAAVELSNQLAVGGGRVVLLYKSGGTSVVNKALSDLATGGETVFISDSEATFDWDLKGAGVSLSANNDQAINVTFSDANSTAIIELQKTSNHSAA